MGKWQTQVDLWERQMAEMGTGQATKTRPTPKGPFIVVYDALETSPVCIVQGYPAIRAYLLKLLASDMRSHIDTP